MRIAICDDNWGQLQIIAGMVNKCACWQDFVLEVDSYRSGQDLLSEARGGKVYEYVFLDIEMPGLSGFDVYKELNKLGDSSVIFVSSHTKWLPEAFSSRAHGFLAKPYTQDTFDRTIESVIAQSVSAQFFQFTHDGIQQAIPYSSIQFFKIKDYILIMYRVHEAPIVLPRKNLNELERELVNSGFFRCNRSTLVNLLYCSGRNSNCVIIKQSNEIINISRRSLKEFDKQLILFQMGDRNAF